MLSYAFCILELQIVIVLLLGKTDIVGSGRHSSMLGVNMCKKCSLSVNPGVDLFAVVKVTAGSSTTLLA